MQETKTKLLTHPLKNGPKFSPRNSPKNGPKNSPKVQGSNGPVHILPYARARGCNNRKPLSV